MTNEEKLKKCGKINCYICDIDFEYCNFEKFINLVNKYYYPMNLCYDNNIYSKKMVESTFRSVFTNFIIQAYSSKCDK